MKGRHRRKSRYYSAPMNSAPTVAPRLEGPLRAGRAVECFLVCSLVANVYGTWVDFAGGADEEEIEALWEVAIRVFPGVLHSAENKLLRAGFRGNAPTILWAATDWIAGLDLPEGEASLWDGPPILQRHAVFSG